MSKIMSNALIFIAVAVGRFIFNQDEQMEDILKFAFWLVFFIWYFKSLVKDAITEYHEEQRDY